MLCVSFRIKAHWYWNNSFTDWTRLGFFACCYLNRLIILNRNVSIERQCRSSHKRGDDWPKGDEGRSYHASYESIPTVQRNNSIQNYCAVYWDVERNFDSDFQRYFFEIWIVNEISTEVTNSFIFLDDDLLVSVGNFGFEHQRFFSNTI